MTSDATDANHFQNILAGIFTSKYVARKSARLRSSRRRRLEFKQQGRTAPRRTAAGPDQDYGLGMLDPEENAPEPENPEEEARKKQEILELLRQSLENLKIIEAYPQGTPQWMFERRLRLTASFFGLVCKRLVHSSCRVPVHEILYKGGKKTPAMKHGSSTEDIAKANLRIEHNIIVRNCGLHVDEQLPFLAASPGT